MDLNMSFNDEMQHEHEFSRFVDITRLQGIQQSFLTMRLDVTISNLGIQILNDDRSFIAEIIYDNAVISLLDKGHKEINIW